MKSNSPVTPPLIGEFERKVDSFRRVMVPSQLRRDTGSTAMYVMLAAPNGSLILVQEVDFKEWLQTYCEENHAELGSQPCPRILARSAVSIPCDMEGRILIPKHLMALAGIQTHVIFTGVINCMHIRNATT